MGGPGFDRREHERRERAVLVENRRELAHVGTDARDIGGG